MVNMFKKFIPFVFLCMLASACNDPLIPDMNMTDDSVPDGMVLVHFSLSGKIARSIMPDMPSLDDIWYYKLWGVSDSSREEIWLGEFEGDLGDASVVLRPGTWNFTLEAIDYYDEPVLIGYRKNVEINEGHSASVEFNLSLINDPDVDYYGWGYVVIELPSDIDVYLVEATIDGEPLDPSLEIDDGFIEYFDYLLTGDYLITFILKDSNDNVLAVINEILIIRGGVESYKYFEFTYDDFNGPPAAPSNFKATAYNSEKITFEWDDNSINETGFVLDDGIDYYEIGAGLTSYDLPVEVVNDINDLSGMIFVLYAVNSFGESEQVEYKIVEAETPPGLEVEPLSLNSILVSWNASEGAISYIIERSTSITGPYNQIDTTTGISYTDTGLTAATVYYYRVFARGILGNSSASDVVYAQTLISAPTGVTVSVASISSITVSWNSIAGVEGYSIYRSTASDGTYAEVGTSDTTSFTDTGLAISTTYYYKVCAYNTGGEGEQSSYVSGIINAYAVTFDINGGSGTAPITQAVLPGANITLPGESGFSRIEYVFDGWNTNISGTGSNYNAGSSYTVTGNITLYAKWRLLSDGSEAYPFPLTTGIWADGSITSTSANAMWYSFNVTSGTTYYVWWNDSYQGNSTKTLDVKVDAYYSSGTLVSGFSGIDSGWNTARPFTANTTGTVKIKVYPYNSNGTGTFAVAYTSSNTRPGISYTVTFNANGGSGSVPETQTVNPGVSIQLPGGDGLSKPGYVFSGWNTNTSGTGTNYSAYYSYTPTGSITLYARWNASSPGTEIITLDPNGEWGWQKTYEPYSLFNGTKIVQGDSYVLTYSFTSNTYIDRLQVLLVDNCQATSWAWNELSNIAIIMEGVGANSVVSGSVILNATGTATNATPEANRLVFQTGMGTTGQPTLTFTTLQIEKTDNSSPVTTLTYDTWSSNYLSTGSVHYYRFYAQSGVTYYIDWDDVDKNDGYFSYWADIKVGAKGEGSSLYIVSVGDYSEGNYFAVTGTSSYIVVEVHGYNISSDGYYRIKYSDY